MSLVVYDISLKDSGVIAELGTSNSALIESGVTLASTGSEVVHTSGNNQTVNIQGTAFGGLFGAYMGGAGAFNQTLIVGENGYLSSLQSEAAILWGHGSTVVNHGVIEAYVASLGLHGDGGNDRIDNSGTIHSINYDGIFLTGSDNVAVTNSGLISGAALAIDCATDTGNISVRNTGTMSGGIFFGDGADSYDGSGGAVSGLVQGGIGDDRIVGGDAAEQFEGDAGRDVLAGGGGADHFIFAAALDSTVAKAGRDLITDFSHVDHDRIDLSLIDATASTEATNDTFHLIGTAAFSGQEGQLRYVFHGGHTLISGDTNGDKTADFEIELGTHVALAKGDFLL